MRLGELISLLERMPQDMVVEDGFGSPHSYRGFYEQLAFEPAKNVTVASMLEHAKSALGKTFQGYKGGEFLMDENSLCHVVHYGCCSIGGDPDPGALLGAALADLVRAKRGEAMCEFMTTVEEVAAMSNEELLDNLMDWRADYAECGARGLLESIGIARLEVLRRMTGRKVQAKRKAKR